MRTLLLRKTCHCKIHAHTGNHHRHHHHHHHVALTVWISLTLSPHPSLSSITLSMFSRLHPVSIQSWCIKVVAGRPTLARPCEGIHGRTSLMSSSLHLQQCPAYLVRLTLMVFEMGGKWPYCCCFVGCCSQDLFKIVRSILVLFPSSFFSKHFVENIHIH